MVVYDWPDAGDEATARVVSLWRAGQAGRVEEQRWGLIERDRETDRIVGLEYWKASERLPSELLSALPMPPAREVVIERQPA